MVGNNFLHGRKQFLFVAELVDFYGRLKLGFNYFSVRLDAIHPSDLHFMKFVKQLFISVPKVM